MKVQAKLQADGSLQLQRDLLASNTKVARYNERVAGVQHELSHRLADVAAIDVELQQLLVQLETLNDEDHDTLSEVAARTKVRGMHKDRTRTIRQLTKLDVRYEKTMRSETVVVRSNCVTRLKWNDVVETSKVMWVTDEEEYVEAKIEEKVADEVGTFPVCFSEGTKKVCVVGGYNINSAECLKSMESYDVDEDRWSVMPTEYREGRQGLATCVLEGSMFVVGGNRVIGDVQNVVDRYSINDGVWSRMANMREKRRHHCAVALGGFVYALGGLGDGDVVLDTMERLNVSKNTWTNVASMHTARYMFGACVLNESVYVCGGWDASGNALSSVERYDPNTNTWSEVASMRSKRACVSGAMLGGYIYACGGVDENRVRHNSVEKYDVQTNTWVEVAPMLAARYWHEVVASGCYLYCMGGRSNDNRGLSSMERYDAVHDRWESMARMGTARDGFGVFTY